MKDVIGFITCADLSRYFPSRENPLLSHDDQAAADALEERGYEVEPVVWGEPPELLESRSLSLLVVRSPWDYMDTPEKRRGFLGWLEELHARGLPVENPVPVIRWNLDKHYLIHLADEDVPIIPTTIIRADQSFDPILHFQQSGRFVVKPCISAGAKDAFRIDSIEDAEAFKKGGSEKFVESLDSLRKGRDFMVQPFIREILDRGEWSVVFLDGSFSHAVLKRPAPGSWLVQDELGGSVHSEPLPDDIRQAAIMTFSAVTRAYNRHRAPSDAEISRPLLYGRVDIIPTAQGPLVGEVELVEPELFFLAREPGGNRPLRPALDLFFRGIERALGRGFNQLGEREAKASPTRQG